MWWLLFFSQKKKLDIESWEDVVQWIMCVLNGTFISDKIVMLEAQHATMPMSQKWENTWWKIIQHRKPKSSNHRTWFDIHLNLECWYGGILLAESAALKIQPAVKFSWVWHYRVVKYGKVHSSKQYSKELTNCCRNPACDMKPTKFQVVFQPISWNLSFPSILWRWFSFVTATSGH